MAQTESTTRLLDRARGGAAAALDALFAPDVGPLERWARGRLSDWARSLADTQDLVQDARAACLRQALLNRLREEIRRPERRPRQTLLEGQPGCVPWLQDAADCVS